MTYGIGANIIGGYRGDLGHLPLYVLIDCSPEYVCEVRAKVGPEPWIVVRWADDDAPVLVSPQHEALDMFSRRLAAMRMYRHPRTLTQGPNEIHRDRLGAYVPFELERQRLMHSEGLPGAYVASSVGQYEPTDWALWRPLFAAFTGGDHAVVHEYWKDGPDMGNTWHVYRWQHCPALANVPLLVGEIGRDATEIGGQAGWRRTCDAATILSELGRYGEGLRRWPNVHGAAIFVAGDARSWPWFDSNELVPTLVANNEQMAGGEPVTQTPTLLLPMQHIEKAWYTADSLFGAYDDHPLHAVDWNLEAGGNSDLGEPLVAATQIYVADARDLGGKIGNAWSLVGFVNGQLVNWHGRHMLDMAARQWQVVQQGAVLGRLGNAGGQYAGAHYHEQICVGQVAPLGTDWRDTRYNWVSPPDWYAKNGVDPALVTRMRKWDHA